MYALNNMELCNYNHPCHDKLIFLYSFTMSSFNLVTAQFYIMLTINRIFFSINNADGKLKKIKYREITIIN